MEELRWRHCVKARAIDYPVPCHEKWSRGCAMSASRHGMTLTTEKKEKGKLKAMLYINSNMDECGVFGNRSSVSSIVSHLNHRIRVSIG